MQLKHDNHNKMELKITEEKENALFGRKEIKGHVKSDISPSRIEVSGLLSERFAVPTENIKIKEIKGKFGTKIFNIWANIYSSKKDKDEIELKKKKETRPSDAELKKKKEAPTESKPATATV